MVRREIYGKERVTTLHLTQEKQILKHGGRGRIKCLHTICWGKIIADSAQLTRDKNVKEEVVGGRTDESWFICSSTELKKNKENFID
jgi:hypothetical protein